MRSVCIARLAADESSSPATRRPSAPRDRARRVFGCARTFARGLSLRARDAACACDAATRALDAPNGCRACIRARARATASSRATRRRARMPCRARVARASDREREGDGRTYPHGVART